jgi:hypothetical protein
MDESMFLKGLMGMKPSEEGKKKKTITTLRVATYNKLSYMHCSIPIWEVWLELDS